MPPFISVLSIIKQNKFSNTTWKHSDGDPEIYFVRKRDREFMLICLILPILNMNFNISIDAAYINCAVVLFYVFIRALSFIPNFIS